MPEQEDNQTPTGPQGPYKPFVPESDSSEQPRTEGTADDPDDSLLQEASSDVGEEIGVPPPEDFQPKRGGKKFGKVLLILILLLGIAGGAYYYFMVYKKAEPAATPAPQAEAPATNTFTPENVAYAFREKKTDPFVMYLRPVAGGERIEAGELSEDSYPSADVYGQNVVVDFNNTLQVSTDGGKTYTPILEPEAGKEITSAAFSNDGSKLGVAILDTEKGENTVSSMGLDGQNETAIFTSKDHAGIDLMGWNDQTVIFDTYTPNSDGGMPSPYRYSVESKKSTQLIKPADGIETWSAAVSDDLTKLVYSAGKTDQAGDDPFALPLAPHTITVVDVATGEAEAVATVGKAGEKATNGTPLQRDTLVGFILNSTTPYYSDAGKLYTVSGTEPTLLYETANKLVDVSFASEDTVIASSGSSDNFVLASFNVTSKEATTILEGDVETILFGITTK